MVKRAPTKDKTAQPACYPVADLIKQAEIIFGVKPEVVAGALHGLQPGELPVDEIKNRITAFLGRKVD